MLKRAVAARKDEITLREFRLDEGRVAIKTADHDAGKTRGRGKQSNLA